MDADIFKAYDIRGVYPDQLNEEDAWKVGFACARFLPALLHGFERGQVNSRKICVSRDMRTHSEALAKALIEGITSAGIDVIDLGMNDTPFIYFAINHLGACGGIQVTASHNPAKYNGFKVSGPGAKPVGEDTGLKDIKHIAVSLLHTKGKSTGSVRKLDLTSEYKKHVLKFLQPKLRKLKIAIDASNGMAGKMVPAIFSGLGLEIVELNFTYDGTFKHDPNPLIEENLREIKAAVTGRQCDFGICFDGDADRLMMVDETGRTIGCDLITALMAGYFLKKQPKSTIVFDLRSSRVVAEEIIKNGGTPRRERVGHAFMKKALRDSHAIFGGELSGHFYYRDNFYADSGMITFVHMLNIVSQSSSAVSSLIKPLRKYFTSGEINFQIEDKSGKMDELARRYRDGQSDSLDGVTVGYKDWWFNCRPSNTEPLLRLTVEAKTEKLLEEKLKEIQSVLGLPVRHEKTPPAPQAVPSSPEKKPAKPKVKSLIKKIKKKKRTPGKRRR
ncbi:MAG: phosphomannomutase/phosphoglucomutase [Sedimentisphaerales bacterium]|nr:phosphomannomutase/phosphoglucomutase [Sedimentisphaerales bacterium]